MKNQKLLKNTPLLALSSIILLLFAGSILYILTGNSSVQSYTAQIYQDGILIKTIDLSTVSESTLLTVEASDGGYNIIEVGPGKIAVVEASCPDHICMKQGFITSSLLPITCLPNHMVIRLVENTPDITPDGITY